jgi:spermidine/putrescine transport system substrate-binding protein
MRGLLLMLLLALPLAGATTPAEVRFFNWSDYLPEEVLERFTAETGIAVRYSTYDSNEGLYAKLKLLGGKGYDLIVPSTYFVDRMGREGLLLPLDRRQLPNIRHLDRHHLDKPFDPGNRYSLPYLWGTTGIAFDSRRFDPASIQSWADLWRPEFRESLLLSNDVREVFHIGLRVLGFSGNTTDADQIRRAYERLRQLLPNVRVFNSDAPLVLFTTGEIDIGMMWSGNAYRAQLENPALVYRCPREGCGLWMDNLAIPVGAANPEGAHRLIDFLLRPDIARLIAEKTRYASPNAAAVRQLPDNIRNNPIMYPPAEILEQGEYGTDVGPAVTLYAEYWERLKAGD